MKRLILIDANALIHRSFHALPPLATKKGELVNAVYGFTAIILKVIKELKPDYIATAFDLPKPTFRHLEFEDYKATRPKTPEELTSQFPLVKKIVKAFNIPIFEKEGYEADDIIGTIAEKVSKEKENLEVIIVTGDLDTLQLVNKKIKVYTLKKGITDTVIYDEQAVKQRYGFGPKQLVDYKGLKGDPSDNIPGVAGIGDKTATKLIREFGSVENLYKSIEEGKTSLPEKLKEKLLQGKEIALFSKKLATIQKDVPLGFDLEKCRLEDYDKEKVIKLLKELEFRSLINRLPQSEQERKELENKTEASPLELSKQREKEIEEAYQNKILSEKLVQLEKELIPVLEEMEKTGIKIDVDFLKKLSRRITSKLKRLEKKIYDLAGVEFNINSSQQLSEVLFEKLGISVAGLRKTPKGVVSTAASELQKLKGKHKIINLILDYRELIKLKTTYIDALPKLVNHQNRIHTTYNQLGTTTGRISSSNPNLQNIPIKGEWGKEIRKAFIAEEGYSLISADYSQIELRIVACIANDEKMIEAFKNNQDIHKITAAEIYNIPLIKVTPEMRRQAKTLNFGIIYGMSIVGFAEASGVPRTKAKEFIEEYLRDFSGVAEYITRIKEKAKKDGYVETLLGRKRFLPEIKSSNYPIRQAAERMAINMPIQGTAADIMKVAMVTLWKRLKKETDNKARILLQVHDELVLEVRDDLIDEVSKITKEEMENVLEQPIFNEVRSIFKIPLEVEIKAGSNWGELIEIKS